MGKRKKNRYVILDFGEKAHENELSKDNRVTLSREVHTENQFSPYTRYHVQRVIPCRFEHGKLYR